MEEDEREFDENQMEINKINEINDISGHDVGNVQHEEITDNCEPMQDEKESKGLDMRTSFTTEDNCDGDDDDDSSSEHELTNLGWLIDLKNLAQWPVNSNSPNRKNHNAAAHPANGIPNCIINDIDDESNAMAPVISEKDLSEERFKKFTIQVKQ